MPILEKKAFCALLKQVQHTLCEKGMEVEVRDLYQLNFQPVLASEGTIHVEEGKFVEIKKYFHQIS